MHDLSLNQHHNFNMLSIQKCRELIDNDEQYSDKQIEEIRNTLYGLAELAFDIQLEEKKKQALDKST